MIFDVSNITGVPVDNILGRSRKVLDVCTRQLYWKLLRVKKGYTFREIAELNARDVATVQYGIKRVNNLLESNDELAVKMWNLIKNIK